MLSAIGHMKQVISYYTIMFLCGEFKYFYSKLIDIYSTKSMIFDNSIYILKR